MNEQTGINRGMELMLRREIKKSNKKQFLIEKTISFLSKKYTIKFEFTWEGQKNL
jgi:hypothetical protein